MGFSSPGRKWTGLTKSLNTNTDWVTITVTTTERSSGKMTLKNTRMGLAPSMIAASSSSRGMVAMNELAGAPPPGELQGRVALVTGAAGGIGRAIAGTLAAYSSAKAAELHLARCLAEEGGAHGIRVNTVNPDAVLQARRSGTPRGAKRGRQRTSSPRTSWTSTTAGAPRSASTSSRRTLPRPSCASRPTSAPARAPATCSTSTAACLPPTPAKRPGVWLRVPPAGCGGWP